jgi:hypothetical protein
MLTLLVASYQAFKGSAIALVVAFASVWNAQAVLIRMATNSEVSSQLIATAPLLIATDAEFDRT